MSHWNFKKIIQVILYIRWILSHYPLLSFLIISIFFLLLTSITMHSLLSSTALVHASNSNKFINIPPLSLTKYSVLIINYRVSLLINLTIHMLNSWNYSPKSCLPSIIFICSWLNYCLRNVTTPCPYTLFHVIAVTPAEEESNSHLLTWGLAIDFF